MNSLVGSSHKRLQKALGWRLRRLLGEQFVYDLIVRTALAWRPFLKDSFFIGITGSAGKTTTKELLLGVLSHKWRGVGNPGSMNGPDDVGRTLLSMRRKHAFCVAELSEDKPGGINEMLALLRPGVGIVTVAGYDHLTSFDSIDGIVAEMGALIAHLPASGTAILNADDERVLSMAAGCAARVITYGISPAAELRAKNVSSVWPERLEMTVTHGAERARIRTRLCGTHLVPSVLSAIGGGLAAGMTLAECAEGIAKVAPFEGRMQPVTTDDGVTFIRDDFKAPLWSLDKCFEFMKAARAERKIVVIGEISDVGPSKTTTYARVAKRAQEVADVVVFAGPWASSALRARKPGTEDSFRTFQHIRDAAQYVNSITRHGDLVLLKGSYKQDHLLRIILARSEKIACWRDDCKRPSFCDECPHRARPSGPAAPPPGQATRAVAPMVPRSGESALDSDEQIIVGLGNPESRYSGTPHNVGHEVVERLAASLELEWNETPEAWIARGSAKGRKVCLIKINSAMNHNGTGLKLLSERMVFGPEQCILVFDDLDTPLGIVRHRLNGSAGGHRGVASILEAFQTHAFKRVKVGVGKPGEKPDRAAYVLKPFATTDRTAIEQAIANAAAQALDLAARRQKTP